MTKTVPSNENEILKIIEKHSYLHHRKLLKIIEDKSLMAKATAEKNIKNLIKSKKILVFPYGKEKQYVLSDGELSQKDLKNKISKTIQKLNHELETIDKEFDNFDYYVKRNLPDYLLETLISLSETKFDLLRLAKETKITDMSDAIEIFEEIRNYTEHIPSHDIRNEKRHLAAKTMTSIDKMQREYFKLTEKRSKLGSSEKRNELSKKISRLNTDIPNLYALLEKIRDELKAMSKN